MADFFKEFFRSLLEVQSWCQAIANAKHGADNTIFYEPTRETGFCWGAFGAIQGLSKLMWSSSKAPMLGICAPEQSTRVQYIKIFSKYVSDHPETAHKDFAYIARLALQDAFLCSEATLPQ
jgi:hypothetical protein